MKHTKKLFAIALTLIMALALTVPAFAAEGDITVNITGGNTVTLQDANEAAEFIREAAGQNLDVIFGVSINEKIGDAIIVTVIATGFELVDRKPAPKATVRAASEISEVVKTETAPQVEIEDNDIPKFFRYR